MTRRHRSRTRRDGREMRSDPQSLVGRYLTRPRTRRIYDVYHASEADCWPQQDRCARARKFLMGAMSDRHAPRRRCRRGPAWRVSANR